MMFFQRIAWGRILRNLAIGLSNPGAWLADRMMEVGRE